MKRDSAKELYSDYLTGDLDDALKVSVENHLAEDTDSRTEVDAMRRVWTQLDAMPRVDTPAYFHENIMSRLDAELARETEQSAARTAVWDWRTLFRPRQLAVAATLLIVLLGSVEAIQSQHAALGPLGTIYRWLRPATTVMPAITPRLEWKQNTTTGGTLVVGVRGVSQTQPVHFRVRLYGKIKEVENAVRVLGSGEGTLPAGEEEVVELPLADKPTAVDCTLLIMLSGTETPNQGAIYKVVPVSLQPLTSDAAR